jgi:WD40 repeat protein
MAFVAILVAGAAWLCTVVSGDSGVCSLPFSPLSGCDRPVQLFQLSSFPLAEHCDKQEILRRMCAWHMRHVRTFTLTTVQRRLPCAAQSLTLEQRRDDSAQQLPEVTRLARAASGALAAGYADGSIRLWDPATQESTAHFQGHRSGISALAFSEDGSLLASGARDTDIVVWDTVGETGLYRLTGHTDQVNAVAFMGGGSKLLSAGKDACLRAWELATQHCSQVITNDAGAHLLLSRFHCIDQTHSRGMRSTHLLAVSAMRVSYSSTAKAMRVALQVRSGA